jgi:hypothetical protein
MELEYNIEEIAAAQAALNLYPDASPFWDTREGQDFLTCAHIHNLEPQNSNRERCAIHRELMENSLRECGML